MEPVPVTPRAAFQHRDFRLYQGANFLSTLALQMQAAAVGYQIYDVTGKALNLGLAGLAEFLPMFLLIIVTGDIADRFDRRRILVLCHAALVAASALLFAVAGWPAFGIAPIYAALVLIGIASAFMRPTGQALVPQLVPKEHFSNAVSWGSSIWQVATIAGPSLGGALYGAFHGGRVVYAGTAALEIAVLVLVWLLRSYRPPAGAKVPFRDRMLVGFRYVREKKILLGAISLDLFAVLLGGATALIPIYAKDILKVGALGNGILRSAPSVGAAIMAIAIAHRPVGRRAGAKMLGAVAVFGVATIVFGISRSFPLSVAMLVLLGAADMVSVVVRQTLVQIATPEEMRGRVSAVNVLFIGASNELGEFESGTLASFVGAIGSVVIGGIGTLACVALWALAFPALRDVDRLEDLAPKGTPG